MGEGQLFHGMLEGNLLTFNPGWNQSGNELDSFTDVLEIQRELKEQGIALTSDADASTSGPASIMLSDPAPKIPVGFDEPTFMLGIFQDEHIGYFWDSISNCHLVMSPNQ